MKELFSLGSGAGYYGTKPNIIVSKFDDAFYPYHFDIAQAGWDFNTNYMYEAAAIIAGSQFKDYEEFKTIPVTELDVFELENAAYWVSGGNSRWRFHNDDYFIADWNNAETVEKVCEAFEEIYGDELATCNTMFDVIQVLAKRRDELIEYLYENNYELWEDEDI